MAEVIVDEAAVGDYQRSAAWLEERSPGRGRAFAHAVREHLTRLAHHPGIGPEQPAYSCRRLVMVEFKHDIFYEVSGDAVNVRAIVDLRRDPRELTRLLTDRLSRS